MLPVDSALRERRQTPGSDGQILPRAATMQSLSGSIMRNRRIALKASVPLLTAGAIVGLTLPASLCQGASTAPLWIITAAAPAQAGGPANARRAADDLLRQARAAIKQSDFQRAETLINDAEKLGVQYN